MPQAADKSPFSEEADILGIYGQNGSGKTAVVEAVNIIGRLLSGQSIKKLPISDYIMEGSDTSVLSITFSIVHEEADQDAFRCLATYEVHLQRSAGNESLIAREILSAVKEVEGRQKRWTLIDHTANADEAFFSPRYRYDSIVHDTENRVALGVAQKISQRDQSSFIFCAEGVELFQREARWTDINCALIVDALFGYAGGNLTVLTNAHSALISIGGSIPVAIRVESNEMVTNGDVSLFVRGPVLANKDYLQFWTVLLDNMSVVLSKMIPDLSIGFHIYGKELSKDGKEGYRVEVVSRRGDTEIPLRYESEGILKLVTILNVLIGVFNNPSMCLVVDELDSGIYEYLLGELLTVFETRGKGQILFTSHNLRPLEMLNRRSVLFSTTNPDNRFIRFQNIKKSNNMRDVYLRTIQLGGQKEEVYAETDTNEIARAFRRAGKAAQYGG